MLAHQAARLPRNTCLNLAGTVRRLLQVPDRFFFFLFYLVRQKGGITSSGSKKIGRKVILECYLSRFVLGQLTLQQFAVDMDP